MKWRGFLRSFVFAFRGVRLASRGRNFRVMFALAVAASALGFAVGLTRGEWIAIVLCIAVVLAAESVNSAIEALADTVHPDRHPGIAATKDLAAGASLLLSLSAAIVGVLVFWPHVV